MYDISRENMLEFDYRIQRFALNALQEATEGFMCSFMESKCITLLHYHLCCRISTDILLYADTNLAAIHAKRVTIQERDMKFMKTIMVNLGVMFFKGF